MPSLILRLEQLPAPARPRNTPTGPQTAPPAALATPAAPGPANGVRSEPQRRYVDVAGQERLNVATPLTRWSAAVAAAHDGCLVIDAQATVISVSVAAVDLLGWGDHAMIGRHLLDALELVDFDSGAPDPDYAERIAPLAVLASPGLSRSLIRVRHASGETVTLDTSAAPIHDVTGHPLGSVTFFAPIARR